MHKYLSWLTLFIASPVFAFANLPEFSGGINSNVVWQIPTKTQLICNNTSSDTDYLNCMVNAMQKAKAGPQAIAIMKYSHGIIADYKTFGNLSVLHATLPGNDPSEAYYIINNNGDLIDIDDPSILSTIDITKQSNYQTLAQHNPNISIWPGNHQYPESTVLPGDIQQLVFTYSLLNGCQACELAGTARVAFDFDADGNFQDTQLLGLDAAPTQDQ